MGFDWKGILGGIAPTLATALGGPAAGALVGRVSTALLGHAGGTVAEIAAAIPTATPEQIASLQKLEQDYTLELVNAASALERIEADDRANARGMQKERPSHTPAVITYVVLGAFVGALGLSHYVNIPPTNQREVDAMIEVLKLLNVTAFGFWLGSSSGNRAKDAVVAKLANR